MTTHRQAAIAVGALFFTATASYMAGSALITAALQPPDHLLNLNTEQLRIGVLLEFINSAAVVGIAALQFPILRHTAKRWPSATLARGSSNPRCSW